MTTTLEWLGRMLQETGVTQAELARAIGVDPTVMSKMVNGRRKISADERARMATYFDAFRQAGFQEEQAAFELATGARAPIYRSRAASPGEWAIDRAAGAIRLERPPDRAGNFLEVFGFHAPDDAAWPRYKIKEIVWVCPTEPVGPGDDALIVAKTKNRTALRGMVGELVSLTPTCISYRDFATGELRQANSAAATVYCLVPREK